MGIRHLNRFFKDNASDAIKFISVAELSGKKIAVDISIYMYKYAADDTLIENIYLMLSVFKHYGITPIFVFDGKAPAEKKALLVKRRIDRKAAQEEYNHLKITLQSNVNMDDIEKQELMNNMDMLKRQIVHIGKNDIEKVKKLMRSYGATYYDAPGEADELCALLTIQGKVWGCLSEDTDMFVYGCPRVIRYLSLLNHTVVLYDMKQILESLGISQKELREICILSGTDYNSLHDDYNLDTTLKQFKKYFKEKSSHRPEYGFYDWLIEKGDYIKDYPLLMKIYDMFDVNKSRYNIKVFENIKIMNGPVQKTDMYDILKTDGFLFPVHSHF